jgi:soluble lytic murein transglycosylase
VEYRTRDAREAYREILRNFPSGEYAERARWKVAFDSYVLQDYEEALKAFEAYLAAYPNPGAAGAAVYWIARCHEKLRDPATASSLYAITRELSNESYYGQRAREAEARLKRSGSSPSAASASSGVQAVTLALSRSQFADGSIPEPPAVVAAIIDRARQLAAAELFDTALAELRAGLRRFPEDKALCYVMARVCEAKEDYWGMISSLYRAFPDYADRPDEALPGKVWELLFPVRHWPSVSTHAGRQDLDPNLILGLIRQESAFNTRARSRANARGLMQVLPSTGRGLARQAGVRRFTAAKLYDPETNIALGARYFASLLRRQNGKVELALAAYNAGATRVERWKREFGNADMAEFVERIPFAETRGYVKQVLSNVAHYRSRTEGRGGARVSR